MNNNLFDPLPLSPNSPYHNQNNNYNNNSNNSNNNNARYQSQGNRSSPLNPTNPSVNSGSSEEIELRSGGGGDRNQYNNNNNNNNTRERTNRPNNNNRNSQASTDRRDGNKRESQLDPASFGVLNGSVGGGFGPFPRSSTYSSYGTDAPFRKRDSMINSDVAIDLSQDGQYPSAPYNRYSTASYSDGPIGAGGNNNNHNNLNNNNNNNNNLYSPPLEGGLGMHNNSALLWDKENAEADDYLHDPDPELDRMLDRQWSSFSLRGWLNVGLLVALITTLVGLFAGWPIYQFVIKGGFPGAGTAVKLGWNIGGINASGQVPATGLPTLIDAATPQSAYQRTGFDGATYNLVFSDEFNTDGRTFWPGDDPWWEATDLHYWATTDLEWYDPDAITTENGHLVITMTEEPNHNLNFRSGMLQSWNKFCFTGGYIEVSMSMPGTPLVQGYWPAAWTQGNLARAGYGATNDGMWPYSYNSCDVGTLPNQTWPNGTWPTAAKTSGSHDYGGELSYLPGQRASACTCPGEDHPGPNVGVGRGAPEIDINEAQVDYRGTGSASQSIQMAPMDAGYNWLNETPQTVLYDTTKTFQNTWHGSINQESMSVITLTDATSYEGKGFTNFGYEYDPGPAGRITWAMNKTATWQLNAAAIGPNAPAGISQRLISEEPMYINLNLAISEKFQPPQWGQMVFPGKLRIDYVRVFQKGTPNVGCDPASHPTSAYINRHMEVYTNANQTTWMGVPGNTMPKNKLSAAGCK